MALIKAVKGVRPVFGKNCFLADNATVTGDVVKGDDCMYGMIRNTDPDISSKKKLLY